ncbi:hypothetical protein [Rothia sp. ZJ932]|uniref:hypothetical protein n=1 Tax=Rothia sp. ZJ932 TaxID=2810516 RepID=UPI001967B2F2|nr:hypothetical protein [Rothia sp. ZJ932]QRZ61819.1 hypothetical protein JR346_01360 [Rothia sp. ZJ932]
MSKKKLYIASALSLLAALTSIILLVLAPIPTPTTLQSTPTVATAPEPDTEYEKVQCQAPSIGSLPELEPNTWSIPAINAQARFAVSSTLPADADTNDGILYAPSEEIHSTQGASLIAGHVDYSPGVLSEEGGELTNWGNLNEANPCSIAYVSDQEGKVKPYLVATKKVSPQYDPALEAYVEANPHDTQAKKKLEEQNRTVQELFRSTGPYSIYLLTCSGPAVADVGGSFQFRYQDNLYLSLIPFEQVETTYL